MNPFGLFLREELLAIFGYMRDLQRLQNIRQAMGKRYGQIIAYFTAESEI